MRIAKNIKKYISFLSATPFHPQWLMTGRNTVNCLKAIRGNKTIVDIGCAGKWPKKYLADECFYVGIDYPETADNWYNTNPDVYADAIELPIVSDIADIVLLIDVLEHLSCPDDALAEIHRVLKKQGYLIMQVPFIYPLHDAPRDFQRYTKYGLKVLLDKHKFLIKECLPSGRPFETSALMANLAISKVFMNWYQNKDPRFIFSLILPVGFLINNLWAKLFSFLMKEDNFMPYSYHLVLEKI